MWPFLSDKEKRKIDLEINWSPVKSTVFLFLSGRGYSIQEADAAWKIVRQWTAGPMEALLLQLEARYPRK